ncbi:sodium:proton antiporter [Aquabacterium sp. NJ1]|uniref:cation:proton antiporter n=1 Tax=Aquabacterium sp. NJ1 TaxID=1538295 RepID=UPI00052C8966|nr:sodium:proton antiporter [Aquabacterium sp. NJ1]KGM39660.1 sodium:proton antiporter [Aquabacterium sp. NJ1]
MFEIAAIFLVVTALLAYVNHRFIGLPTTIGVMVSSLVLSLFLLGLDALGFLHGLHAYEVSLLRSIDFSDVLMQGMLSLLLFAGALHVDLSELRDYRWQIGGLAVLGTLLSTAVVGLAMWAVLPWLGWPLPLIYCLLFGALISPTDPIAVMGIMKSAGAPRCLELVIAGESLFNDGVGVVIFSLLLGMAASGDVPTWQHAAELLAHEAGGGLLLGWVVGYATFRMLRSIDQYQVEVLITLASVMGGYALANRLHVSGPLAMVVAGLIIGNQGRSLAMSDTTRHHIDLFWELLDEILNAVLFVLIGMEVVVIRFAQDLFAAAVATILITLAARWLSVGVPVRLLRQAFRLPKGAGSMLTWGGLRGGISVALALSLPAGAARESLLALTYCVVVWSILGQGLTISHLARRMVRAQD